MINLKQLAQMAGVDVSTVSRALNDSERVKPQTKALIKSLAEKHHYVPNDMARSLVGKKNDTIGVLVPELLNTFYAEVIEGIEEAGNERGYSLMFGKSRFAGEEEIKLIDMFMRRRVDGIILCSSSRRTIEHLRKLKKSIPVVIADTFEPYADLDVVTIDHEYGVGGVIDHLLALGHRKFGYIGDSK
ncbi:MAG: LacI family DNA-binding transcriptional regulator, partial [Paenibacillaceae bacterium]|nr:LacI family DNA-binding transcriptional regulator [Paenibacillaceae bacterium]